MLAIKETIEDSYLSLAENAGKVRTMQDIMDCLFFLDSGEKECKHCKRAVTCGFTWQALFSLNS